MDVIPKPHISCSICLWRNLYKKYSYATHRWEVHPCSACKNFSEFYPEESVEPERLCSNCQWFNTCLEKIIGDELKEPCKSCTDFSRFKETTRKQKTGSSHGTWSGYKEMKTYFANYHPKSKRGDIGDILKNIRCKS